PTGKWADMDFLVDDTTTELTGLVRDMGERLVTDESLRELDARFGPGAESGGTDRSTARVHSRFWEELVRAGVPAALGPESLGGAGLGVVGEALVMRELGRVLAPVPLSPAIRGAWVLEAAGLTDRAASVAEGREVAAVADGSAPEADWAPVADVILRAGDDGLRLADRGALQGERTVPVDLSCSGLLSGGRRAAPPPPRGAVQVERTVPVDFSCSGLVSGDLGAPTPLPAGAAEYDALRHRVHLAAHQWGVVEAALERTAAYATTRHQFGRPIGSSRPS